MQAGLPSETLLKDVEGRNTVGDVWKSEALIDGIDSETRGREENTSSFV